MTHTHDWKHIMDWPIYLHTTRFPHAGEYHKWACNCGKTKVKPEWYDNWDQESYDKFMEKIGKHDLVFWFVVIPIVLVVFVALHYGGA